MHCTSRNSADAAVFADKPPRQSQLDTFLASILAENTKKYTNSKKRSCPFAGPAIQPRPRPNDDIEALQHEVEELEAKLADARRQRAQPVRRVDPFRLRSMLQTCHQQAQQEANIKCNFGACMPGRGQLEYEDSVDAPVFKQMEKNVATQYKQLAQVFRDADLDKGRTDFSDAKVVTNAHQGTFVRFTMAKMAPFPLDSISNAMWKCAKKHSVLNMKGDYAIESKNCDMLYLKRECMLQGESNNIPVLLRSVCRRFVEPDRVVVVWDGVGDWPKSYLRTYPGSVPIRERGYCVFQSPGHGVSKGGQALPLSQLQSCVCMKPGLSAEMDMNSPECLQMLQDVVIPSYRKILDEREQMLENAILDEIINSNMRSSSSRR
ncbi:hypothetical protein CCR75_002305 [Bremia lactucae]|uniref:Uncharacterized protein n=1 Tax=Bremia lactucae TaxID=4779 RepID=A0A976FGJ3_BRELC|nr:hypothetical protein CCR75_002305 [Bremia lactucae]